MSKFPVIKPTEQEKLIWTRNTPPVKTGGLVRNEVFCFQDVLEWSEWYREPDKLNPDDWERKLLAGCRGEWFAHVVDGRTRVLDVGCGFGFPSFYLARYEHEVVGVDPSPSEIATAKAIAGRKGNPSNVSFQVIENNSLPFDVDSFDAATLGHSLECAGDPEALIQELKRVLKPASPVAIVEEDRSLEPRTHPVWEKSRWAFFDDATWIWYEARIRDPYLDRRYMIKVEPSGETIGKIQILKNQALSKNEGLPVVDFKTSGISLEEALSLATDVQYSEARGYDPETLSELLVNQGLTELRFCILPDGAEFARSLASRGLLEAMPDDVRGTLRALVKSVPVAEGPISTTVSCMTP